MCRLLLMVREHKMEETEALSSASEISCNNEIKENGSFISIETDEYCGMKMKKSYQEEPYIIRDEILKKDNVILPNVKELTRKFSKGIEEFTAKPTPNSFTSIVSCNAVSNKGKIPSVKYLMNGKDTKLECTQSTSGMYNLKGRSPRTSSNICTKDSSVSIDRIDNLASAERLESAQSLASSNLDKIESTISVNEGNTTSTIETNQINNIKHTDIDETKSYQDKLDMTEEKEASKQLSSVSISKFPGKEVHSLTARSISKEFREELKNNSSRRSLTKINRGNSGEEGERAEIASESIRNRSPTPTIDLQSKRKFWEDIILHSQK